MHKTSAAWHVRWRAKVVEFFRELVVASLLVVAIGALGWIYVVHHLDERIRAAAELHLQQSLQGDRWRVSVQSARRVAGEGIELRGVRLHDGDPELPLAEVDEVQLRCGTELADLVNQQMQISEVVLRRPRVMVRRRVDGTYPWEQLASLRLAPVAPDQPRFPVRIEGGMLVVQSPPTPLARGSGNHDSTAANPARSSLPGTMPRPLELRQIQGSLLQPLLAANSSGQYQLRLEGQGSWCDELSLELNWELESGAVQVTGHAGGVRLVSELTRVLPVEWLERLGRFTELRGDADVRFECRRQESTEPWRFVVAGDLLDGRWEDRELPAPITDLEGHFSWSETGGAIEQLTGRCGDALLEASLHCEGYAADSPLRLTAKTRHFDWNRAWIELLPSQLRAVWEKFAPLGRFDADLDLRYDGQNWQPDIVVQCHDVSFTYHRFPYRLHGGQGLWEYRDGRLTTNNFQASVRGRPIVFHADLRNPGENFTGVFTVDVAQPVPLDDELISALPEQPRSIVRSLQPQCEWTAQGRFQRTDPTGPVERAVDIDIHRGAVQYTVFPYPLTGIHGQLRWRDDRWDVKDLTGMNDSALVVARGGWNTDRQGETDFQLDLEAADVPLEEELKRALAASGQRLWSSLQPRGTLDYLTIGIRKPRAAREWSVEVYGLKRPAAPGNDGRYISVRPSWAPFPLENVTGAVRYRDGHIELDGLRAEHGRTVILSSGLCELARDGGWSASLNRVSVDRLTLDRETLAGLPSAWSTGLARLNWSGPIQATGSVNLAASAKAGQPISASWDLNLDVENGSLKMGVPVEQIRGEVHLIGQSNAQSVTSQGELRIDSALCQGIQITQLRGPFRLTPQRLIFGDQWADRGRAELPPRPITAQLFGGRVAGDAVVTLADESLVRVQADIQNVDLGELSREFAPKGRDVVGRAFAAVKFEGTSRGLNTWRGGGKVTCRDADFFEVPVMAAMVKTARGLPADQAAAFQLSDVDFRFDGERVYFDRIDFKGDAVTLRGAGEMSLNRHVDLQFYTLMARDELKIPVLGPMLNEASRQIMEVRVTGPLEEPTVDKKVVPVINEALQKMFPELTGRTGERKPWSSRVPGPAQLLPFGAPR
ncbi:MAG: hypothetical protein ACKPEY_08380 [Planctomycetota bacterium]